jgi:hypothetical protein
MEQLELSKSVRVIREVRSARTILVDMCLCGQGCVSARVGQGQ